LVRILAAITIVLAAATLGVQASQASPLVTIVYRPNGKLISLPVRINRSNTLWFIFDTGARYPIVDSGVAKALRLHMLSSDQGAGVGRGTFTQHKLAPLSLSVGLLTLHLSGAEATSLRNTGTHDPYAGVVGWDLLKRYVVRIDPVAHTIAFYDPVSFTRPQREASVPISSPNGRLFVDVRLTINGSSVVRKMRVDTGSEDAVSDNLVRESSRRRKSLQGVGLGTPYVDYSGVFDAVQIGPYTIRNAWGPSNDHPSIGMEILRRVTLTFDVAAGRLYLEPNEYFPAPVPSP
jgi:hypothetical protein